MNEQKREPDQWMKDALAEHQSALTTLGEQDEPDLLEVCDREIKFDFVGMNLSQATFRNCKFRNTDFSVVNFLGTKFIGCQFYDTDFSDANLKGVYFSSGRFFAPIFSGANLTNTDFNRCRFFNPVFSSETIMKGTIISRAIMGKFWTREYKELLFRQITEETDLQEQKIDRVLTTEEGLCFLYFLSGDFAVLKIVEGDLDDGTVDTPMLYLKGESLDNLMSFSSMLSPQEFSPKVIRNQEKALSTGTWEESIQKEKERVERWVSKNGYILTPVQNT